MDHLQLPRQEDVSTIDIIDGQISIIKVTAENKDYLVRTAMSMYLNERCKYCPRIFETLDDLQDAVFAGYHEHGRLACSKCWADNNC